MPGGLPQLWAPAHTLSRLTHAEHRIPRQGSCSITFCRLDSCSLKPSPPAQSFLELLLSAPYSRAPPPASSSPASQGQMSSSSSSDSLYQPANCSLDLSKDGVRLSALELGSSSGGPAPSPGGMWPPLTAAFLFPLGIFSLTLPSQGPLPSTPG